MTSMGIDLGTTYSCVGICRGKTVEIISNSMGNKTTPSMVAFIDDDTQIGESAAQSHSRYPAQTIYDSKRMIGKSFDDKNLQKDMKTWPFKVIKDRVGRPKISVVVEGKEKEFFPEEISSLVLKRMSDIANTASPTPIKDAVITVPAYFTDAQRQCTIDAGKRAGLNVLQIINEPTAASIAFGVNHEDERTALVFDFGGGTFDVTILEIEDMSFNVKATGGDDHLGGQDIDALLVAHFAKVFKDKTGIDISEDQRAKIILKHECEKLKKFLSTAAVATLNIDRLSGGKDLSEKMSRAQFEDICRDLLERCMVPVRNVLEDAGLDPEDITDLVLVGGSSRIPYVKEMLRELFPSLKPYSRIDPDEAVAYGAAVKAFQLAKIGARAQEGDAGEEEDDLGDITIVDVSSRTYGIEIDGQRMEAIVPRNSAIPTVAKKNFTTVADYQELVDILVFQGEEPLTKDNLFMGQFQVQVPPKPKGDVTINVAFKVTSDGVLDVTVEESANKLGSIHINCVSNRFVPGKPDRTPKKTGPKEVDLCFCVDGTGSMGKMIAAAKERCVSIAAELKKKRPEISIRYGAVFYRDPIHDPKDVTQVHAFTEDINKFRDDIAVEKAQGGGGDGPEDWVSCYNMVFGSQGLGWRVRSFKIIIHVADACAHGKYWGFNNHEEQAPILQAQIERLAREGFFFSGIAIPTRDKPEETFKRVQEIYTAKGRPERCTWQLFSDPDNSKAGSFLESFVVNAVTSIVPK